jgi:hypothetical protein
MTSENYLYRVVQQGTVTLSTFTNHHAGIINLPGQAFLDFIALDLTY